MPGSVHIAVGSDVARPPADGRTANQVAPFVPMLYNGTSFDLSRTALVYKEVNNVAVGTITTIWTPAAGKRIVLLGFAFSLSVAASLLFEDNSAGNFLFRTPVLVANTPYTFTFNGRGLMLAAVNNVLRVTASAAANLTGTVFGTEE